jgi:large subunit ribosomal protein L13
MNTHTIDATGKILGRLSSEVAVLLRGKDKASFAKHIDPKVTVKITNASALKMTGSKLDTKVYRHYTGHPGGMRAVPAKAVIAKKGHGELIKKAVKGMLPNNKLRDLMLKRLIITE